MKEGSEGKTEGIEREGEGNPPEANVSREKHCAVVVSDVLSVVRRRTVRKMSPTVHYSDPTADLAAVVGIIYTRSIECLVCLLRRSESINWWPSRFPFRRHQLRACELARRGV